MSTAVEIKPKHLTHKIRLHANHKFLTYCSRAAGVQRKTYNWCVDRLKQAIDNHEKIDFIKWKKDFTQVKRQQFPYMYEVTKYASAQPFFFAKRAFEDYCKDKQEGKTGCRRKGFLKYHQKRPGYGSFYIGGDQVYFSDNPYDKKSYNYGIECKHQYIHIPKFGWVKMYERLRFQGHIENCTITYEGDKVYACVLVKITQEEYLRTHKGVVAHDTACGIDVGLKSFITTDTGLKVDAPKPLKKQQRRLKHAQRCLNRRQHPTSKNDTTQCSKNFYKQVKVIRAINSKVVNTRHDFNNKLSSVLLRHYEYIGIEDLNVSGMLKNHKLAKALTDAGFRIFREMLTYKALWLDRKVVKANMFFASTKICSNCGHKRFDLTLRDRVYVCPHCGMVLDRDQNAGKNLLNNLKESIGVVSAKFKPMDQTAMQSDLAINRIVTSWDEVGIQQMLINKKAS